MRALICASCRAASTYGGGWSRGGSCADIVTVTSALQRNSETQAPMATPFPIRPIRHQPADEQPPDRDQIDGCGEEGASRDSWKGASRESRTSQERPSHPQ